MRRYGKKTYIASVSLILAGIALIIISLLLRDSTLFEGLLSLSAVFIFSGAVIYFVIYRQFKKLEEIAEEVEEGKI